MLKHVSFVESIMNHMIEQWRGNSEIANLLKKDWMIHLNTIDSTLAAVKEANNLNSISNSDLNYKILSLKFPIRP